MTHLVTWYTVDEPPITVPEFLISKIKFFCNCCRAKSVGQKVSFLKSPIKNITGNKPFPHHIGNWVKFFSISYLLLHSDVPLTNQIA